MFVDLCATPEVFFVVDGSESVSETNFELQRTFVQSLVTELFSRMPGNVNYAPRVGLIEYSSAVTTVSGLESDSAAVTNAINSLTQTFGVTATGSALQVAEAQLNQNARVGGTKIIILLTDGPVSQRDRENFDAAVLSLPASDIDTVAIGVGGNSALNELLMITENNLSRTFEIQEFSQLNVFVDTIIDESLMVCPAKLNICE